MALVGYTVMVSVPVLSTALVAKLGFTEEQVGRVWGADLGGLSFGAILSAMLVARVNRRHAGFGRRGSGYWCECSRASYLSNMSK